MKNTIVTLTKVIFATAHGEGALDGVRAFVDSLQRPKPKILFEMTQCNVICRGAATLNKMCPNLPKKFNEVPNITGIRMMHSIFCDEDYKTSTWICIPYSIKTKLS